MDIDNRKELTKADATNLSPDDDGPATVTAVGATDAVIYGLDSENCNISILVGFTKTNFCLYYY